MATEAGTVSTKGQVTIPKDVRIALGLGPGDTVLFDFEGGDHAILRKGEATRLTEILDRLGPGKKTGVEYQRELRNDWERRGR